jgi:2'-5' RNA ligase
MADVHEVVDEQEEAVAVTVAEVLDEVADEFAAALAGATELVAARFSVSRIAEMFTSRMPRIVRRLLGVSEQAANTAADDTGGELPDEWEDLPGRYDDGTLPPAMSEYVDVTEHLLRAVGDRLAEAARDELAAGVDAGDDMEALRARLRDRFAREGSQLGEGREERVARTESGRAWNTATLGAAQEMTGPSRPLVKQWLTRRDDRVRHDHADVNGQLRLLDEPFTVGGVEMSAPHDPTAPAKQVVNCRCLLAVAQDTRRAAVVSATAARLNVDEETAARLAAWEHPDYQPPAPAESQEALAAASSDPRPQWLRDMDAELQRRLAAAGVTDPGSYRLAWDDSPLPVLADDVTAAAVEHTGAMIALIPTEEDAERLALDDGELADELHLTLWFLGEGADWGEEQRRELVANVTATAADLPTLTAYAFGVNHWNPGSDSPSWVWAVGDDRDAPDGAPSLHDVQNLATRALEDGHNNPELPVQHSPWVPHICGAYDADPWPLDPMTDRVGPVTFDRIRIAFAGERTDIQLGTGNEEQSMPDNTAAAAATEVEAEAPPETRSWSNPDDTALAFEDMETGDGRLFTAGAISWDTGPWPLQYADEMLMGHQGAELAGAIDKAAREGQRITGSGVLYLTRPAGLDAVTLLEQEAPLGVSVDLDDVDVEFVDRTLDPEEDGWMFASATLPAASVLRMADGSLMISAQTAPAWTASGGTFTRGRYDVQLMTGPSGTVTADAIRTALAGRGVLTAAAGDSDDPEAGIVVHSENAGDFLMRITRARLRGATLVAMPAYAGARIVLDPLDETAAAIPGPVVAAAGTTLDKIVTYVRTSPAAVGPRQVAKTLGISMTTARTYLNQAVEAGRLVRLAPGMYAGPCTSPEGPPSTDGGDRVTAALDELSASAWRAMQDTDPMPAEWFREPTAEELPPGSGGVHYKNGRVYGWVAQAGVPHAGFPGKKLTIESLGKIDLSHFLRAKFATDDGGTVRAGSFTMNVPHNRDGAECQNEVCQFDDSRTVAGIVTVGMNKGGMWFSGAAAPWLSEWDRNVFRACQPSYHMKQGRKGWELRAVLTVPVPGHSSPLVAAAVTERSNLALAASSAGILAPTADSPDNVSGHGPDSPDNLSGGHAVQAADQPGQSPDTLSGQLPDIDVDALAAALVTGPFVDALASAMEDREAQRRAEIEAMKASVGLVPEEITASAAVTETKEAS